MIARIDAATALADATVGAFVVLSFGGPACAICKRMEPMLARVASERANNLSVRYADVEARPDLAQAFDVRSLPTLIALKDTIVQSRKLGFQTADQIRRWLDDVAMS